MTPSNDFKTSIFIFQGVGKDQHERDICRQAVQLEEEQKEQRLMKTEEQLKSFRIELQKTQEQQERRRIQQETAKVFLGTVIHRQDEAESRLLKTIRLIMTINKARDYLEA